MDVIYFETQADFRAWLEKHHDDETEIQVGFYKVGSGKPSISYKESVDEALCFGWIDGIRNSIDGESYTNRFTPRKPRSIWSAVNLKRFAELKDAGRVHPAGLKVFEARDVKRTDQYSSEQTAETLKLSPAHEAQFRANEAAWAYFQKMPPSYKKPALWWVVSAKQDATREKRLAELIACSGKGLKIPPLRRKGDKSE